MIVLNEHMAIWCCFVRCVFSKALISRYIRSPPAAFILRCLAGVVIKGPESTIRKTFVIISYFFILEMNWNIIKSIMFKRIAICFRTTIPPNPDTLIFTKYRHECRNKSTWTCFPWTLWRGTMYRQSVRDDNQITTPVSFTHSSSLWRTQKTILTVVKLSG